MKTFHTIEPKQEDDKITRKDAHEILMKSYFSFYGILIFYTGVPFGFMGSAFFEDKLFNNYLSILFVAMALAMYFLARKVHKQFKKRLNEMLQEIP